MKKCNTQIMKEIKTLEEYRAKWIGIERANCTVSYLQGEEPVLPDYDYETTRANVDYLDNEIRRLKGLLAYSNVTTIVNRLRQINNFFSCCYSICPNFINIYWLQICIYFT